MFLNARIHQLQLRLNLPSEQTFDQIKDGEKGKQVVGSVIKLLRIGAFFKYITQYSVLIRSIARFTRKKHVRLDTEDESDRRRQRAVLLDRVLGS